MRYQETIKYIESILAKEGLEKYTFVEVTYLTLNKYLRDNGWQFSEEFETNGCEIDFWEDVKDPKGQGWILTGSLMCSNKLTLYKKD